MDSSSTLPHVVCLVSSAGALEPLRAFFRELPAGTGRAFLVLQHHAPGLPRLLPGLLDQQSGVPVRLAQDGDLVRPDEALVLTSGMILVLREGGLRIQQTRAESTQARPGDLLLLSAAECLGPRAVGIVLSGAGRDGTAGLQAVRAAGGLTLAQEPAGAEHASMPASALASGAAVEALDPRRMPDRILDGQARNPGPALDLAALCAALARRTGHDFHGYKKGTLERRTLRRMHATGSSTLEAYLKLLETSPGEGEALLKELLIGVTGFFRDRQAFESLGEHLGALLRPEPEPGLEDPLRIWVPGCSTGEEAYSLAILVRERLDGLGSRRRVQVFATDIDTTALIQAKSGLYPAGALEGLAPKRRRRFFTEEGGKVRVAKELREMCVFSSQNILRDPPFSSLHLVSCRNLFIYLQPSLQRRLVPLLHFALKPGGLLFLGSSEGLAGQPDLFEALDTASRVFRRREGVLRPPAEFASAGWTVQERRAAARPADPAGPLTFSGRFERMLMEEYVPASALVNESGDVLFCAGRLGRYLHPPAGAPSSNLLTNTTGPLHRALRRLLAQQAKDAPGAATEVVLHDAGAGEEPLRVTVRPMPGMARNAGIFAVILQQEGVSAGSLARAGDDESSLLEQMDQELRAARLELQVTVEQLESTNEELRSSNEELQSSNEELNASQEELQSVNEELNTTNDELQEKIAALDEANADLQNLLVATDIATLFLDSGLRVARFTPAATTLFALQAGDLGRPVTDLPLRFAALDLAALAGEVLATQEAREAQAWTLDRSRIYLVQVRPYRALDQSVLGAVATFVDCTEMERAHQRIQEQETRFRDLFSNMVNAIAHCRMRFENGKPVDWLYLSVNQAFQDQGGKGLPGRWVSECLPGLLEKDPELVEAYGRVAQGGPPEHFEIRLRTNGEWYDISTYHAQGDEFIMIFDRITARKRAEEALLESEARYRGKFEMSRAPMLVVDPDTGAILDANPAATALYGWSQEQLRGLTVQEINAAPPDEVAARLARTRAGETSQFRAQHRGADGLIREVEVFSSPIPRGGRTVLFSIVHDIGDRLRAERALRITENRMRLAMELSQTGGWEFDRETGLGFRTPEHARIFGDPPGESAWSFSQFVDRLVPEDRDRVQQQVRTALERQTGWNLECRIRRRDGAVRWIWARGGPLPQGEGRPNCMAGILQDITERKEAEAEMRALEAQVGHLHRLESVGRLAGGVAHDMNNLLAAIMAVGSLLKVNHAGDAAIEKDADTLLQAAGRGRDLVKALRDFSRKELGSARDLDLNDLVRQEADLLERTTLKRIKVRRDLAPDLPQIFGEAGAISNALMNLCANACDAMPTGGVLTLATRNLGGAFVELVVQDSGEGMAPEVLAHAMDPFFTTKPAGQGTGLGLSQVYGTIKAHGGSLDIQSWLGQGTRVAMAFPLAPDPQNSDAGAETAQPRFGPPMRILLVDDEDLVRESARLLFEAIGHQVRCAEGGPQALALLGTGEAFDLVILDLNMPDMDGVETLNRLRKLRPELKVILATGYDDERIPPLLGRHDHVRILMKPFALAELGQVLAGWVQPA